MAKVLLVEDDLGLQQLTREYLEHNGLTVDVLDNGAQVMASIESDMPDLMPPSWPSTI